MMRKNLLVKSLLYGSFLVGSIFVQAQTNLFKNGKLAAKDNVDGAQANVTPEYWKQIPVGFKFSNGKVMFVGEGFGNTSDITSSKVDGDGVYLRSNGASVTYGGESYDKETTTFTSAIFGFINESQGWFHEGIMQTVSGLEVGKEYILSFMQAIVQQARNSNKEGQWRIYAGESEDTLVPIAVSPLIKISEDRLMNVGTNGAKEIKPLVWEKVTLKFIPTAETMTIGFGSWHPDEEQFKVKRTIRLGIDDIWLYKDEPVNKACFKDANTSGAGLDTNHGITLLQRAGQNDWPTIRKGAWTALESNTKGFVITRMTTAQVNTISNPQEGMITYDTDEKCLKLYDGTKWSCFSTPSCPTSY